MKKQLENKQYCRNPIKAINTWVVVSCSEPFLKRKRKELQKMNQRTRKVMTMCKALHPRDDINRLYESGKEEGRGSASIKNSIDTSIRRLEYYKKKQKRLIEATRNNSNNRRINRITITRKQKCEEKQLLDISSDKQAKSHTRRPGHG